MILRIAIGLIGLGIVVLIHEAGHFIVARLMGIGVEAFSVGWGRPWYRKKIGGVEYRLGIFPVGGYCQMRGENEFREALLSDKASIPRDKGTFYGAHPFRRIAVAFAGPFANVLFAIIVLAFVWGLGFSITTNENRVVLASELDASYAGPADAAGLRTGDRIISVDSVETLYAQQVQEHIAPFADKKISLAVERDGSVVQLYITPKLDKETGAGRIGIFFWTEPVIGSVTEGGTAAIAGLVAGDQIRTANGLPIRNSIDFAKVLKSTPSLITLEYVRKGILLKTDLIVSYTASGKEPDLGFAFKLLTIQTPHLTPLRAIQKGASESWNTFYLTLKSFSLFFKGIDMTKAVSGPVRITYLVGDVATQGFDQSLGAGFSSVFNFLALISVILALMNLLPLPALDGGMIVMFLFEFITRRPLNPKHIYYFQVAGSVIIFGLLLFSLFGDVLFLIHR